LSLPASEEVRPVVLIGFDPKIQYCSKEKLIVALDTDSLLFLYKEAINVITNNS